MAHKVHPGRENSKRKAKLLDSLQLRDFRCFGETCLDLGGRDAVFIGRNAQGKTSILESICVLLRLQSPRANTLREMVHFDSQEGFFVGGNWSGRQLKFGYGGRLRRLSVDGSVTRKTGEYLRLSGHVVWMGNSDLLLVSGRGEGRRRYLDFIGSQIFPDYLSALRSYERAMRARNNLLKDLPTPWAQVDAYSRLLVQHGEILLRRRSELVALLQPWVVDAGSSLSRDTETASIDYRPKAAPGTLSEALEASREADARRGQTTVGPHRDELALEIDSHPAGTFGSEGQQRTFALALKLAQARLLAERDEREKPILLIDDIFGELDPSRRNALLTYLPEDSQKLITTTHLDWAEEQRIGGPIYHVEGGILTRQPNR